ncbi:glycerophosphodiester phosphodiesterase [Streptomyces sp. N2-109]|uniref:glycerophosphodiester phosphodiesterase n=1 Tax=Streptomyces gossypii TaxID=2883101 RepID=A0ABT2JL63_9ACTN|nr:glycerophosphodiester phosphodiesterase [Streptomyces gossypii]MCT2588630.1 glycerophosphodiester phosphodiesterase [Streptomyces gossypii]
MSQEQRPGRRALLGAAAVGAGVAALGPAGAAYAADGPGSAAASSSGGSRHRLPVPAVVAHRGASGYRPEHTLGAYELALEMGADIIEQDVVPTKDGHLVCRHENDITGTTDVADHPEFAGLRTTKTVDGKSLTGWFTEDFTLSELKTLRAKERLPKERQHNTLYDGRWEVPTFEEVLRWADQQRSRRGGSPVWLHVETKHPSYFRDLDLGLEERLAKLLRKYGRHHRNATNFVQSFEPSSVRKLGKLVDCPGVVLLGSATSRPWDFQEAGDPRTVADLVTPEGLKWISRFAKGIGPTLDLVIPKNSDGSLGEPTTLVRDAHAQGLVLHPYTMRNENAFLPREFRRGTEAGAYGDAFGAYKVYLETGIDGVFSDNPDTTLLAAEALRRR